MSFGHISRRPKDNLLETRDYRAKKKIDKSADIKVI
jgi:hypothetical protein